MARFEGHIGDRQFACIGVGPPYGRALLNGRMPFDGFFDDARIDAVAAAVDHVLGAAGDVKLAVVVQVPMSPVLNQPSSLNASASLDESV